MASKSGIVNTISIIAVTIAIITAYLVGIAVGISEAEPTPAEKDLPEYIEPDSGTYWAEVYDDGRFTIHTHSQWVESDGEDLVIRGTAG